MHVIRCGETSLTLTLPACVADPTCPSPAPGAAALTAHLTRRNCPLIALTPLPPEPGDAATTVRLALPSALPRRGVWGVSVRTACGCYRLPVFVDSCAHPALPAEHLPTRNTPAPVPVACPPVPPVPPPPPEPAPP